VDSRHHRELFEAAEVVIETLGDAVESLRKGTASSESVAVRLSAARGLLVRRCRAAIVETQPLDIVVGCLWPVVPQAVTGEDRCVEAA